MIAMLLAAQIAAAAAPQPTGPWILPPPKGFITPLRADDFVRPPGKVCSGNIGRMEVSMLQPTALYRKGDRPAKGLKNWVDFPNGQLCLVGTEP
jgi:hypothetical protein